MPTLPTLPTHFVRIPWLCMLVLMHVRVGGGAGGGGGCMDRWNEQFVIDVQPDEIYGSKMVIELCERLPSGDDLVVGLVFPPIGTQYCHSVCVGPKRKDSSTL